jgi:predicted transcriptional regulator
MKLILLALFFPLFCFAQNGQKKMSDGVVDSVPGTSIVLKNYEVVFQKVYTSKLTADELGDKLFTLLSTTKGFRFDRRVSPASGELIGKLIQYDVDVQRYGGNSIFGMMGIVNCPSNASVVISVKDFKYRVTVSDLTFTHIETATKGEFIDMKLSNYITKKNRSRFGTGKSDVKLARVLDQDFSDKFDLQKSNLTDDF